VQNKWKELRQDSSKSEGATTENLEHKEKKSDFNKQTTKYLKPSSGLAGSVSGSSVMNPWQQSLRSSITTFIRETCNKTTMNCQSRTDLYKP
jgi:hypothetical protein